MHPDGLVKALYSTIFGRGLVGEHMAYAVENLTASNLAVSLVGAYLWTEVFSAEPMFSAGIWMGGVKAAFGEMYEAAEVELGSFDERDRHETAAGA